MSGRGKTPPNAVQNQFETGQIVFSKRGRDARLPFVVLRVEGEYLYLADGRLRPAARPKKKKIMHVQRTNFISEEIRIKMQTNEDGEKKRPLLDADIRRVLSAYVSAETKDDI